MSAEALAVSGELEHWVATRMQGRVVCARTLPGGKSRMIQAMDVERGGRILPVLVRCETGNGPHSGTRFTLAREAALLRALEGAAASAPRCYGISDDGRALLMERLTGVAPLPADGALRRQVIAAFAHALSALHRLDAGAFLPEPASLGDSRDAGLLDLADYEDSYRRLCIAHDIFEQGFDWLRRHAPPPLARSAMVHGDAGPGNFMHEQGRITGLIDWEMAHGGDPHDDLAWIWFRVNVLHQDSEADSYFAAYAAASGLGIEPQRVIYFIVQVILRCAVCCGVRQSHDPARDDSRPRHLREMLQAALDDAGRGRLAKLPPLPRSAGP